VAKVLPRGVRGGFAAENDVAVFVLLAGKARAALVPKYAMPGAIELALLDSQGREAGPVESVRMLGCASDEAILESASHSAGLPVKATWAIGGSRAMVRVTPLENAGKVRIEAPVQYGVAPDRFGDDIVADPKALGEGRAMLPWAPLVLGLLGNGSDMLVLISPEEGQRTELRRGEGSSFAGADAAFQNRSVSVGVLRCERAWHLERFAPEGAADPVRFKWLMPFAAAWRLTVQGDAQRYSAFFSERESALFDKDKKEAFFRKNRDFAAAVRLGVICLYGRTAGTPPEVLTPVDLMRDALGLQAARRALDEEGLTGYRRAAGPTTWAELSLTIDSLRYLFERQLEVQDSVYARHLCDDLPPFVEGMDRRLKEYADFASELDALCKTSDKTSPAAAKFFDRLGVTGQKLRELGEKQRDLRSSQELLPPCAKIRQLTAKQSNDNRKQFEECCKEILRIAGPREEMLRAYRKLALEVTSAAGIAPLAQAELLGPAEKIRAIGQGVLRNRFYVEADWRGEDYNVPAFWLGPRPYE
jgi:hypothetical protein